MCAPTARVAPTETSECPRPAHGRGKPLPYGSQETLPGLGRGGPWASCRDLHQERWLGKARRTNGTALAEIFANPGPSGPAGIQTSHSDFARRKFCKIRQVRVPRNGGSRGRAAWRQERLCRSCRLRPPPSVFWFLFHVEKKPAPQGGTFSRLTKIQSRRDAAGASPRPTKLYRKSVRSGRMTGKRV